MTDAIRVDAWDRVEGAFTTLQQVIEEMRREEREVFHKNAEALQLRADALIARARTLRELNRVKALVSAVHDGGEDDGTCVIAGRSDRVGETVEGTTPAVRVAMISPNVVMLAAGESQVAAEASPPR